MDIFLFDSSDACYGYEGQPKLFNKIDFGIDMNSRGNFPFHLFYSFYFFHRLLLLFTVFCSLSTNFALFHCLLLPLTVFCSLSTSFALFHRILLFFTVFCSLSTYFASFHRILLPFTVFCSLSLSFAVFYRLLLSFTVFCFLSPPFAPFHRPFDPFLRLLLSFTVIWSPLLFFSCNCWTKRCREKYFPQDAAQESWLGLFYFIAFVLFFLTIFFYNTLLETSHIDRGILNLWKVFLLLYTIDFLFWQHEGEVIRNPRMVRILS